MLHLLHYPHELIAERVVVTPHLMGQTPCDNTVPPEAIRPTVFAHFPPARLQTQLQGGRALADGRHQ